MNKLFLLFILFIFVNNCANQINYSGKIIEKDSLENIKFVNKENLLNKFGNPSFIDPISNKYFYYSEKEQKKSIFAKKKYYSYIFVFAFNEQDSIISTNVYDLKNKNNINLIEKETSSEIIKRGLLERVFGGVGPQQEITTTP